MQIDRSNKPKTSGEVSFKVPGINKSELQNRLKIYFSEKNSLPIIRISLICNSGSRFDPENLRGLSNLLTMCIDEGAGNYNSLQLADEFEMLGAQFNVSSDSDITVISLQTLSENFLPALKLFKSVITEPHLRDEDFNREKRKVLVKLKQLEVEPDYIADLAFDRLLFGKKCSYAYPPLGIERSIQNIFPDQVRSFYKQKFFPQNSSLIVVGDIDSELINNILTKEFSDWNGNYEEITPEIKISSGIPKTYIIHKADSVQTEIRTGHITSKRSDEDFIQKQILNMVIGGQFSSRLNLNLREKHGYTYGIHSRFSYYKLAGHFSVSTSVITENTVNALKEILSEIKKAEDGITNEELSFARSSLMKRFPSNFETYRQLSANISSKVVHNLSDDYFETYLSRLKDINLTDVNTIANTSITSDKLVTVLVGDSKKITDQINEEQFGEIAVLDYENIF